MCHHQVVRVRCVPVDVSVNIIPELHDGVSLRELEVAFGPTVLNPHVTVPFSCASGKVSAWPVGAALEPEVVLHLEGVRPDTNEVAWFAAICGRYSDPDEALAMFVDSARLREPGDKQAAHVAWFDGVVDLADGVWWQPPLLSRLPILIWRAPLRLLRLVPERGIYCQCEVVDRRLDEPGYFAPLSGCRSFLLDWIS